MKNPWVWIWGKQGHLQLNPNMNECTGMESQTPLEFWYSQAESLNDFPLPGSKFLTLEDVSKLQCRFSCPFYTCVGMVIEMSFIIRFHWDDFYQNLHHTGHFQAGHVLCKRKWLSKQHIQYRSCQAPAYSDILCLHYLSGWFYFSG